MVVHIAIYKWKQNATEKEIEKALDDVRKLKHVLNGIHDIRCGKNFSKWNEGYTHAIIVLAKDREALEGYRNHPDHKEVATIIEKMELSGIGIDFED